MRAWKQLPHAGKQQALADTTIYIAERPPPNDDNVDDVPPPLVANVLEDAPPLVANSDAETSDEESIDWNEEESEADIITDDECEHVAVALPKRRRMNDKAPSWQSGFRVVCI